MKINPKGPLADSIDLYLAHKRSLGKQLAKVRSATPAECGHFIPALTLNQRQNEISS